MVVLANYVWIYGGIDDSGIERSSLWSLRVPDDWDALGNWTEYKDQKAGPRSMHCSVVRGDRAYVWGGQPGMCLCMHVCEMCFCVFACVWRLRVCLWYVSVHACL